MVNAALIFERAAWSEAAAARLATMAGSDADLASFAAHAEAGAMWLLEVRLAGELKGFVIWSLVDEPARCVVVINAAVIDSIKGADMTEQLFAFGHAIGERHGADVLRFWTQRAGLVRKLAGRMSRTYVMEAQIGQQQQP